MAKRKNSGSVPRVLGKRRCRPEMAQYAARRSVSGMRRSGLSRPIHASKFEDAIIKDLEDRGIEYDYEPKTFIYQRPVRGALCKQCGGRVVSVQRRYTPDIFLKAANIFVEAKGKFTSENRAKMEDFLQGDPGIDLRFIFMRDNWITPKHKSKYSDWCEKVGVKYHVGTSVPEEWVYGPGV